jgi:hypothetical protein
MQGLALTETNGGDPGNEFPIHVVLDTSHF